MKFFTIGHSSHSNEQFLKLLHDGEITLLIDVRAFPGSRKFPHFHEDRMKEWMPESGIGYKTMKSLGGRRNKSKVIDNEVNAAWNNQSFHKYADYALQPEFQKGIEILKEEVVSNRVAICCSERHPARCHR